VSERRLLQLAVAAASLIPLSAGAAGMVIGPAMVGVSEAALDADSHYRYLSGLLFGLGIAFATTVPAIDRRTGRFRLLVAIVFVGGLGRLMSLIMRGAPHGPMLAALVMELGVAPALAAWQARIAGKAQRKSLGRGSAN
jgi:peptidoglycan/LPS O-acetylase OafA/YrhL